MQDPANVTAPEVAEKNRILQALALRTHPFFPKIGPDGAAIADGLVAGALDPRSDPRLLHYYFDLYDWSGSNILGGISREKILMRFPGAPDLRAGEPLLVILSGTSLTGRLSLANLILFAFEQYSGSKPIVVPSAFDKLHSAENLKDLARRIIPRIAREEPSCHEEKLWSIYNREVKESGRGSSANYQVLFEGLALEIRSFCSRPIAVVASGKDSSDFWRVLYNTVRSLVTYILVITSRQAEASLCNVTMSGEGGNVAHIHAPALDLHAATRYAMQRLTEERTPDARTRDPIAPFTNESINSLYEPTGKSSREPIVWPIGWLRRTLGKALDEHLATLASNQSANSEHASLIDASAMRATRARLNSGG